MKDKGIMRLASILVAAFCIVFAGYHAFRHFYSSYSSVSTYRYTVYHSALTKGILIRDEKILTQPASGYIRYAADEGEKVKAGSVIAYSYSGSNEAATEETAFLAQKELSMLGEVSQQYQQDTLYNVTELSGNIDITLNRLSLKVKEGDYSTLEDLRLNLQKEINAKELLTGDASALEQRITALSAAASQSSRAGKITSSGVGYFSHCVDQYESVYTPSMIGNITSEQLSQMLSGEVNYQENALGKLVLDEVWYYVTEISNEQAEHFPEGSEVSLTFSGSNHRSVSAKVASIQPNADGKTTIITLKGNEINSDTVSLRTASVKISSKAYTGIRFDADLLHILDGIKGVYVDSGYAVKFKKVDIIYAGNGYYLSKLNYTSEESLNLFDKLLITKSELYDGKSLDDL